MNIMIAGASSGIGQYLTEHFDKEGNELHLTYNLHPQNVKKTVKARSFPQRCDFSRAEDVKFAYGLLPPLDVVINCMGHTENHLVEKMDVDEWDRVIESNLKTVFLSCKEAIHYMKEGGHIINISSVLGSIGMPGASNYCAAKGAVEAFTRTFAQECLMLRKVFVNAIALGYFNIGMGCALPANIAFMMRNKIPLGEFGDPKEIALAVDYVVSSKYLVGTTLHVNGGLWNS